MFRPFLSKVQEVAPSYPMWVLYTHIHETCPSKYASFAALPDREHAQSIMWGDISFYANKKLGAR